MIDLFWRCLYLLRSIPYCFLKCRNFAILFTTQEETYPLHHQYQIKIMHIKLRSSSPNDWALYPYLKWQLIFSLFRRFFSFLY
jgi:hypothetical protein